MPSYFGRVQRTTLNSSPLQGNVNDTFSNYFTQIENLIEQGNYGIPEDQKQSIRAEVNQIRNEIQAILSEPLPTNVQIKLVEVAKLLNTVNVSALMEMQSTLHTRQSCSFPTTELADLLVSNLLFALPATRFAKLAEIGYGIYKASNQGDFSGIFDFTQKQVLEDAQIELEKVNKSLATRMKRWMKTAGRVTGIIDIFSKTKKFHDSMQDYLDCTDEPPQPPIPPQPPRSPDSNGGGSSVTGMGSALPPGGNGGGNIPPFDFSTEQASLQSQNHTITNRFMVKVFTGDRSAPFTALTDVSGYFHIPFIPADQPFTAIATNLNTGETRKFEGSGPKVGKSIYMHFDFVSKRQPSVPKLKFDTNTQGKTKASKINFYTFQGAKEQLISLGSIVTAGHEGNDGSVIITTPSGKELHKLSIYSYYMFKTGVLKLPEEGTYTVAITLSKDADYTIGLSNIQQPKDITIEELTAGISESMDVLGDYAYYKIDFNSGDLHKFVLNHPDDSRFAASIKIGYPQTSPFYQREDLSEIYTNKYYRANGSKAIRFSQSGSYILQVTANNSGSLQFFEQGIGAWQFKAFSPIFKEISIDQQVNGTIGEAGQLKGYTLSALEGTEIYVQTSSNGLSQLDWELRHSNGKKVFEQPWFYQGVVELKEEGSYTAIIGVDNDLSTGSYGFKFWNVPQPDVFTITVGDTVSENVPENGAGTIESPGVKDIYKFQGSQGQIISIDVTEYTFELGNFYATLASPSGNEIARSAFYHDSKAYTLPETGEYTITVGDNEKAYTGTYKLELKGAPQP